MKKKLYLLTIVALFLFSSINANEYVDYECDLAAQNTFDQALEDGASHYYAWLISEVVYQVCMDETGFQ